MGFFDFLFKDRAKKDDFISSKSGNVGLSQSLLNLDKKIKEPQVKVAGPTRADLPKQSPVKAPTVVPETFAPTREDLEKNQKKIKIADNLDKARSANVTAKLESLKSERVGELNKYFQEENNRIDNTARLKAANKDYFRDLLGPKEQDFRINFFADRKASLEVKWGSTLAEKVEKEWNKGNREAWRAAELKVLGETEDERDRDIFDIAAEGIKKIGAKSAKEQAQRESELPNPIVRAAEVAKQGQEGMAKAAGRTALGVLELTAKGAEKITPESRLRKMFGDTGAILDDAGKAEILQSQNTIESLGGLAFEVIAPTKVGKALQFSRSFNLLNRVSPRTARLAAYMAGDIAVEVGIGVGEDRSKGEIGLGIALAFLGNGIDALTATQKELVQGFAKSEGISVNQLIEETKQVGSRFLGDVKAQKDITAAAIKETRNELADDVLQAGGVITERRAAKLGGGEEALTKEQKLKLAQDAAEGKQIPQDLDGFGAPSTPVKPDVPAKEPKTFLGINMKSPGFVKLPGEAADDLTTEARKFKSADEFVESLGKTREKTGLGAREFGSMSKLEAITMDSLDMGDLNRLLLKENNELLIENIDKFTKSEGGYKIFRALPFGKKIEPGDFVFSEKRAAEDFLNRFGKNRGISEIKEGVAQFDELILPNVPEKLPRDFSFNEFIYSPKAQRKTKQQLTDIWNQANTSKISQSKTPQGQGGIDIVSPELQSKRDLVKTAVPDESDLLKVEPSKEVPTTEVDQLKISEGRDVQAKTILDEKLKSPEPTVAKKVDSSVQTLYDDNFKKNGGKGSIIKEKSKDIGRSIGGGIEKAITPISTRLGNISPELKNVIRKFEFGLSTKQSARRRGVEGFLKKKGKSMTKRDRVDFDLALKNRDTSKVSELVKKYGLENEFSQKQKVLDELFIEAKAVGFDVRYLDNFSPRKVKDPEGLLNHLYRGEQKSFIQDAIAQREAQLERVLTLEEKATLANTLLRGFSSDGIMLSTPGALKQRGIPVLDADLNKFYFDSDESLLMYIDGVTEAIESRKIFGKFGKDSISEYDINDTIGAYTMDLLSKGKIDVKQEVNLRGILNARFNRGRVGSFVGLYKNLSYIDTMGSTVSAVTQLGDLGFSLYFAGAGRTVKNLFKKSRITVEDLGIEKIAEEFDAATISSKLVNKTFAATGLNKMDRLGKELLINSSLDTFISQAKKNPSKLRKELLPIFEGETDQLIKDLVAGDTTENVKLLLFNRLLDVQPVKLSEMPEMYLKANNGKIFYMLKTFTIKQFDLLRNEALDKVLKPKSKEEFIKGFGNLLRLTGFLAVANATADEIKDFMLNRETSGGIKDVKESFDKFGTKEAVRTALLGDRAVDNILKLVGFSKYTIYQARTEGAGEAFWGLVLPPRKAINAAFKDFAKEPSQEDKNKPFLERSELVGSIPIGGKLYYWWFGKGASKTQKRFKDSKKEKLKGALDRGLFEKAEQYQQDLVKAGTLSEKSQVIRRFLTEKYDVLSISKISISDLSDGDARAITSTLEDMTENERDHFIGSYSESNQKKFLKIMNKGGFDVSGLRRKLSIDERPKPKGKKSTTERNFKSLSQPDKLKIMQQMKDKGATDDQIKKLLLKK